MTFAEILEQVEMMTREERQGLMKVLREAEKQDKQKAEQTANKQQKSFAEAAAHLIGSVDSGLGDLSTNKKYMEGFGRDKKRNY
jgi:uncharacterized membrane protein